MRIEIEVNGQRQRITNTVYSAQYSENCLECLFDFKTDEWKELVKTAHFKAEPDGEVYSVVLAEDKCLVPSKVLEQDGYFSFSVIGEKDGYRITTAALSVLNRSAVYGGEPQEEAAQTQYEQLISLSAGAVSAAEAAQSVAEQLLEDAQSGRFNGRQGETGPQGEQGPAGEAATITVGTVETGEPDTPASVTNSGTENAAVFDFVIPKGEQGEKGERGEKGEKGDKGDTGAQGEKGEFADVDSALDEESTAPVQNKVITTALAKKQDTLYADFFVNARYNDWVSGGLTSSGNFADSDTRIRSGYHYFASGTQIILSPASGYMLAAYLYSKAGDSYTLQSTTGWVSEQTLVSVEDGVNYAVFLYGDQYNTGLEAADGFDAQILVKLPESVQTE